MGVCLLLVGPVVLFEHGCMKDEQVVHVDVLGGAGFRVQKQRINGARSLLARLKALRSAGLGEIAIRASGQVEYHEVEVAIVACVEADYPRLSFGGVYYGHDQPRGSSGNVLVPMRRTDAVRVRILENGLFYASNAQTGAVGNLEEGKLKEILHSLLKDDPRRPIIVDPRSEVKWQVVREVFVLAKDASRGGVWLRPSF